MLILGIETSTPVCSVALVDDGRVCAQYTLDLGIHHSEHLFPMIQRVLADRGLGVGDLDGVAVASGPGSFTGVRIGLASAKSLCLSADIPLVGVSSLAGLAFAVGCDSLPVCAMFDARRDQVYMGVYQFEQRVFVSAVADCADELENVIDRLPRPVYLVGDGAHAHRNSLLENLGKDAYFAGAHVGPEAGSVALLGVEKIRQGVQVDLDMFEPQYLRASQAEQAREARLAKD